MAKVYEVAFKIGANMASSFAKTMSGASGALGELNKHMSEIGRQQAGNKRVLDLRNSVAGAAKEFNAAKQRVAQLGAEMKKTDKPTKAMRQEYERAQQSVKKAHDRLEQQRNTLKEVTRETGNTGKSTAQLVTEQNRLAQSGERAAKSQAALQKNLSAQQANIAKRGELRGQLFDAVGLATTLAVPVKMAMDWEQQLAEFNKVADLSTDQLAEYSTKAQELAVATGVTREGIMGAYIAAGQAGFDPSEWEKFADVSSKMGVAFDTTGDVAGEMLKAWRSSMALTMDEAEELAAAANHLANNMNATALDVGEVLQRQGSVLKTAGLSDVQGAALAAAMLSGGAAAEVAATASKNFASALTKGSSASKAQKAALAAIGFHDPVRLAKAMQKAPEEAIMMVLDRLSKVEAHEQMAIMSNLFGSESIGGIAPLIANMDTLANAFGMVSDRAQYLDSLEKEFDSMGSTTQNQLRKAVEGMKMMATTVGTVLLPPLNQFLATMAPIAMMVAKFAQENQTLVTVIVGVTAALIGFKIAAIAGGYAFTFIRGAFLTVQGMLLAGRTAWLLYTGAMVANTTTSKAAIVISKAMTAAQWLFNAAMSANPIGLVVVAIGALVAAGIWMYRNWETVTAFFGKAWEFIKNLFINFHPLGWIMGGIQPLMDFLNQWGLVDLFTSKFNAVKDWLLSFSLFDSGAKLLTTLSDGIKSAVSAPVDAIKGALSKVREYLPFSDAQIGPLSDLTYSGMQILSTIANGIKAAIDNPVEAIKGALSKVREYLPFSDAQIGPLSELTLSGSKVMSTLAEGMRSSYNDPMLAVDGGLSNVASGLSSFANGGGAQSGGGGIVINLNQEVHVNGGGADVYSQAKQGASDGARDLINDLTRALSREGRLSYG